jgi:hypothetical protein
MFTSSGEGRDTPTLLGPLETVDLKSLEAYNDRFMDFV